VRAAFAIHPAIQQRPKIQQITGIHRSPNQVSAFLKRLGMQRRKMGFVPGKSGTPEKIAEQERFREEVLEPLLAAAKAGTQAVFCRCCPLCSHRFFRTFVVLYAIIH